MGIGGVGMPQLSAPRALVTGGSGFIGSNLVRRLLRAGGRVTVVDDFTSGSRQNLSDLLDHPRLRLICADVTRPLQVDVDEIYHLACPASPVFYQQDPLRSTKTSILGSINMLDLATRLDARILFASTSEVYGDPEVHPQPESYWGHVNPIGPRSCYDEGKRCAETLFFDYHRQHRTQIKVARIFNTYGPGMRADDGRVVSNFIVSALTGRPLTVYGSGAQSRSFCYVDDLTSALTSLMRTAPEVTGPVNLGNPDEVTMKELADLVIELVGRRTTIEYRDLPADDPARRRPDIDRARRILHWQPTVGLTEGLTTTIEYFRRTLS